MRYFALFFIFLYYFNADAQDCTYCTKLSVSENYRKIRLDSFEYYELVCVLTNCGSKEVSYFPEIVPQNDDEPCMIHVSVHSVSDRKNIYYEPIPYNMIFDPVISEKKLKKGDSYIYKFFLKNYFEINGAGRYYITAYYKKPIFDSNIRKGYYMQISNEIDLDLY